MSFFNCAQFLSRKLAETGLIGRWHRLFGTSKSNPLIETDSMCCCVPLRTAVFLNAFCTTILCIILIAFKHTIEDEFRPFQGGYARRSMVVIEFIELTGVCWGTMGVIGAVFLKASFIQIYLQYQVFRICAIFYMYWTDVPLLWNCENWRSDLYGAIEDHGWNPVMYKIAMGNTCFKERWHFIIFSGLYLLCLVYFAGINRRFLKACEDEPRYLLTIPKDHPSGAFYCYSSGMSRDKKKQEAASLEGGHMGMMGQMAPPGGHPGMMPPGGGYGMPGMMGPNLPLVGPPMGIHGPPMGPGMMGPGMMGPGMMGPGMMGPGMMGPPMH